MHTRSAVKGAQGLFAVTLCMGMPLVHAAGPFLVKGSAGAGGILNATSQTIVDGKKAVFLVEAKTGYKIKAVTGCNGQLSGTTYTTAAIVVSCIVKATFAKEDDPTVPNVTLKTTGTGTGTVAVVGADKDIPPGTTVKLTATPDEGSTFAGWAPAPCNPSFAMPAKSLTCTATFTQVPTIPVPQTVRITGGCFQMGSPEDETDRGWYGDETAHEVCVDDFEIGQYEVTFDEYSAFCEAVGRTTCSLPNDNDWGTGKRPVINVSWNSAVAYTKWLSAQTGMTYRLPTEAEWEYAARAGTTTVYWTGNSVTPEQANFGHWLEQTTEVGAYAPNPWKLYDTIGNVWEWTCSDWSNPYNGAEKKCGTGSEHAFRGGSWAEAEGGVRSAVRASMTSGYGDIILGFRIAKSL